MIATALALAVPVRALADTRLFTDSSFTERERFSVEILGKGPDLVFVPGLSSSRDTWRATAVRLKGSYRLHLIQLGGFAGEPARANATGEFMVPVAEAIDAYLVEARLAPTTYIGHSLGGTLGLYLAQKHPDHFKKMMVVDSLPFLAQVMGFPNAEAAKPLTDALRSPPTPAGSAQIEAQIRAMVTSPADQEKVIGWSKASDGRVVGRAYAEDIVMDMRPGLAANTVPTTLIYPRGDAFGMTAAQTDAQYQGLFKGMAKLTMVGVDGSRHFVMFDQPDRFAQALDAFLKT